MMKTDTQAAPRPENGPKLSLFARLWAWMQGLGAPAPLPLTSQGLGAASLAPLAPVTMATEAVPDAYGDFQREEIAQTKYLMNRICAINNAHVAHAATRPRTERDLTAAEWDQAARLTGVVVVDPNENPSTPYEGRRPEGTK